MRSSISLPITSCTFGFHPCVPLVVSLSCWRNYSSTRIGPAKAKTMASSNPINPTTLSEFHEYLQQPPRVMVLSGAGLSAGSGLPTFRGKGGLWRNHISQDLATPGAFRRAPDLVWAFYSYRRHMSLQAKPNAAHYALAEYARRNPNFIHLTSKPVEDIGTYAVYTDESTRNVDGLSQIAQHPPAQLKLLHGTLFEVKCFNESCDYRAVNFQDPIVPSLALPADNSDPTSNESRTKREIDISDASVHLPDVSLDELRCPKCERALIRPGVVWFGEQLPTKVLDEIEEYFNQGPVHLLMVVGTSATVHPAAGYIDRAREHGARVCVVNMDEDAEGLEPGDFQFVGNAAEIVPELLRPLIGVLQMKG